MKMYTQDGTEVSVVKKIEEGYLAKVVYDYWDNEGDELEDVGNIMFFEKLYEEPPTEKLAEEIAQLTGQKQLLEEEISSLQLAKRNEKSTLNKISEFPFVQKLVQYLTGDFKLYMWLEGRYELEEKSRVYYNHDAMKLVKFKGEGFQFYKLSHDGSESYDDRPFMVFNTPEEALEYLIPIVLNKMNEYKKHEGWSSSTFSENMGKICNNALKTDPRYIKCYDEVYAFIVDREKIRDKARLQKEIEELDAKRKKLEELNNK